MSAILSAPFSQDALNRVFTISPKHPDRLLSRESGWLEFKESFSFGSLGKYIRTAAGFANAKGGYIVYGIGRRPHTLLGMKKDAFDVLDPERLTQFLNEHFDPEIHWDRQIHELAGKKYGLLYVYESENKPVVCKKGTDDGRNLKEAEIYYRYSGRTQVIRYPELKELIDERRKREQLLWFKHLKEIARIGIRDVGLFDLRSGAVTGPSGSFLIDESLLSQVAFIREGDFDKRKGKPALKIVGTAQPIGAMHPGHGRKLRIVKTKGIRAPDVMLAFLNSEKLGDARGYITQICYESSAFLPVYFLVAQAGLTLQGAIELIEAEHSTSFAKTKLLERMDEDDGLSVSLPSPSTDSGRRKLRIRKELLGKKNVAALDGNDLGYALDMIRTLERKEIDERYLKDLLKRIFNRNFAKGNSPLNDKIRRAVCYLDWCLYRPRVSKLAKPATRKKTS